MMRRFTSAPKPAPRVAEYISATDPTSGARKPYRTPSYRARFALASAVATNW
jgi:hypothetical protein